MSQENASALLRKTVVHMFNSARAVSTVELFGVVAIVVTGGSVKLFVVGILDMFGADLTAHLNAQFFQEAFDKQLN